MEEERKVLLVGDNPFHGISHLSQQRARDRGEGVSHTEHAAQLVISSLEHGAEGFMFSVSETTLSILREVFKKEVVNRPKLYALVPYAYEYVRLATQVGGISGLAKRFGKQILFSRNVKAIASGLKGVLGKNPEALFSTYLSYEISRIRSSTDKKADLGCVLLHEIVTDMALALDLEWVFKFYMDFMHNRDIKPGFNTRNFPYLINKFKEWNVELDDTVIAAPFNKVGFQMNPSKTECEKALANLSETETIAISILAAGYLNPREAIEYIAGLSHIKGVAVGVSKERHAHETFPLLRDVLEG